MKHKLLLADDSVTIQRVIELTFADEDVQVLTAGDGEQAIARVEAEQPDIVLADIGMPKRSGYEVSAFIKSNPKLSHIPVLLLTGAFEPVDEGRARQAGCNGVLVKPFEPQHVIARVRELLDAAKGATSAPNTTRAVADVPRPVERLATHRPTAEPPRRDRESTPVAAETKASEESDFDFTAKPKSAGPTSLDDSLDDYFDRLDAAFANLETSTPVAAPDVEELAPRSVEAPAPRSVEAPAPPPPAAPPVEPRVVHQPEVLPATKEQPRARTTFANPPKTTLEWPALAPIEGPALKPIEVTPLSPPAAKPPVESAPRTAPPSSAIAEASSAIADAFSALLAVEQGDPPPAPVRLPTGSVTAVVVPDEMIDKIAHRVLDRLAPGPVRDIVLEVAERLVREEIDRIKAMQGQESKVKGQK